MVGMSLVAYYINNTKPIPAPTVPVVVPNIIPKPQPEVPVVIDYVLYDEYDKAIALSKKVKKPIVLIFGASWCPYCKDLKKDSKNIDLLKQYIVCFLDTDKQKELVNKYKIKGLPTSVILTDGAESARKSGYKRPDYETWLNGNLP